jgi:integrase
MKKVERALTPMGVKNAKPGLWCDGGGLYLQVAPKEATQLGKVVEGDRYNRSWIFRYRLPNGKLRSMGLGPTSTLGLAEAREKARQLRQARLDGRDPIEERRAARVVPILKVVTFDEDATAYIAGRETIWKGEDQAEQWKQSLRDYVSPVIGKLSVAAIDTRHITSILDPLWIGADAKPQTASRIRNRIEAILDYAQTKGHRSGLNPARWRGHLSEVYPSVADACAAKRERTGRDKHHPALPYRELGTFLEQLRQDKSVTSRALQFIVLTAVRRGEALQATWSEIDFAEKLWIVPKEHLKSRLRDAREHRVPLSEPAIEILRAQHKIRQNDYIFAGDVKPIRKTAIASLLTEMGRNDITTHGFRSTFRDWAAECTNFPRELAEVALAHKLKDKTEEAYQRGDLLEKRRKLMNAWGAFAGKAAQNGNGNVTVLHRNAV